MRAERLDTSAWLPYAHDREQRFLIAIEDRTSGGSFLRHSIISIY